MSNIKLVLFDLDGTALNDEGNLDEDLIDVSKKLKEKGILVSCASGRNEVIMKQFINLLDVQIPYITDNGANIFNAKENIKTYFFEPENNNIILKKLYAEKIPFNAYSDKSAYYNGENSPRLLRVRGRLGDKLNHQIYDDNKDYSNESFYKITLDSIEHPDMSEVLDYFNKNCHNIYIKKAEGTFYAITAEGVDKGRTVLELAQSLNIKPEEVMIFGDNNNDVSMFKVVEESVCVANAKEEIKAQAKYICDDNNHHGVSKFLKEYFNL